MKELSEDQLRSFREAGFLVVPGVLGEDELRGLQDETAVLVERASEGCADADFKYRNHELTDERVPYRIEYVVDKTESCKALLGHPFVLRAVEQLQGPSFIPTWDSMVFKQMGAGAAIPWHRDADRTYCVDDVPIFNVDFYLDASDRTNCLWVVPGSHRWSDEAAAAEVARLGAGGFRTDGAVPVELAAGDVLLHDILLVHGSPPAQSGLRRVLYFEFRPLAVEMAVGPHVPDYVALKQQVLQAALDRRAHRPFAHGEERFVYRGELVEGDVATLGWRFPHERYWRSPA